MKQIIITIDKDCKATVETSGYKGKGCAVDSKVIQDALGITTKTIYNKLAHYRAAPQQDDPDLQQLAKIEN